MIQSSIGKILGVTFPSGSQIYYTQPYANVFGARCSYNTLNISPASLYNGVIHIWSGYPDTTNRYAKYDIATNTWSYVTMPSTKAHYRYGHGGGIIGDYFYIFGGRYSTTYYNDTWRYDIAANTWLNMSPASPPTGRYMIDKQSVVYDEKLYVLGGRDAASADLVEFWVYDPSANTWTSLAAPSIVYIAGSITAYNGKIYYLRGNASPTVRNLFYCYDIATNTWDETSLEDCPTKLYYQNLVSLDDGNLIAVAGYTTVPSAGSQPYSYGCDLVIYNIKTNKWRFGAVTSENRYNTVRAVAYKGQVYVYGGIEGSGAYQYEMMVYPNPLGPRYIVREEY